LLQEEIKTLDAIGDFDALNQKLLKYKQDLESRVTQNREKNTEIKQALLESLAKIVDENNWKAIDEVKELLQKWQKVGKAKEELDLVMTERYESLKDTFFEQRKELKDAQKELQESRIANYREIIQKIEALTEEKNIKENKIKVEELVQGWKNCGAIPKASYDTLFALYKKTLDQFYGQLKNSNNNFKKNKDLEKELLVQKKEIVAKIKDYIQNTPRYQTKDVQTFKEAWNKVGKVSGKILGSTGDSYYQDMEYLFEYANLQNYQQKRGFGQDKASLLRTIKRFVQENEDEIKQFKLNQEQMQIRMSQDAISSIINKRLEELEKKLKAKKRILNELSNNV
jgi:hypothetical protein